MDVFARGTLTGDAFDAQFKNAANVNTAPDATPTVEIKNPAGTTVVGETAVGVVQVTATGLFRYPNYLIPVDAPTGTWTITWRGLIGGVAVVGVERFSVVATGVVLFPATNPWISSADAQALTGVAVTEAELNAAAEDVYMEIAWTPEQGVDLTGNTAWPIRQRRALGEAIAWQAVERQLRPPSTTPPVSVTSESIGQYSVSYAEPVRHDIVNERSKRLLAGAGLYRRTGKSRGGFFIDDDEVDWIIKVVE